MFFSLSAKPSLQDSFSPRNYQLHPAIGQMQHATINCNTQLAKAAHNWQLQPATINYATQLSNATRNWQMHPANGSCRIQIDNYILLYHNLLQELNHG